jgi:signal transduction histidine kinase
VTETVSDSRLPATMSANVNQLRAGQRSGDTGPPGGEQNEQSHAALEQTRPLGNFLRELAHELGNIAFPLRMIVELNNRSGQLSQTELAEVLQHQVAAIQTITRRLQTIGRCLSSGPESTFERLIVADVVDDVLKLQHSVAADRGHTLTIAGGDRTLRVFADRDLLTQAISELVQNALQFTPGEGQVEVALQGAGPNVEILVSDQGCGVPAEVAPRLFDPFVIGRQQLNIGDGHLGCGLTLVRQVAAVHRGKVELRRSSTAGSVFALVLPRAD